MFRKLASIAVVAASALGFGSSAAAFAVYQDGLGVDVTYSVSGQTVSFTYTADFTGATTSWIGETMDAFSLQFGAAANATMIDSFTATITGLPGTNTAGTWTGFRDKVSGTGCSNVDADALCYTVLPTATGGDGATIIAATTHFWYFDVTFDEAVDVAEVLAGEHSIKFLSVKQLPRGGWTVGNQLSQEGPFTSVPEPISAALVGAGLLGMALLRRRKGLRA